MSRNWKWTNCSRWPKPCSCLRLADVEGGDIKLTHMGKRFADGELNERKEIFSRALMDHVPLAAHIRKVLDERASHSAPKTRFLDELEDHMAEDAAEETLKTVVSLGALRRAVHL